MVRLSEIVSAFIDSRRMLPALSGVFGETRTKLAFPLAVIVLASQSRTVPDRVAFPMGKLAAPARPTHRPKAIVTTTTAATLFMTNFSSLDREIDRQGT